VWNDAQRGGRDIVRKSVEDSLRLIGTSFLDLVLIHWPVPQFFRDTYKELEFLHKEDKIKSIGLSNFSPQEYEQLMQGGVTVLPEINQMEISPAMYRKDYISFFQQADVLVSASKALSRGTSFGLKTIVTAAENHSVTPAQVMLRWLLQKGLICVSKTVSSSRMQENRDIFSFELNVLEMSELDNLTTNEAVKERNELENLRKTSM
jgi:diketogulonate reductase-like aldo/keto reductase